MASSIVFSASSLLSIIVLTHTCSALPNTRTTTATLSNLSTFFHNETACRNNTASDSLASSATQNHTEFVSTTTFSVFSVLLAFGSLIVSIIGVMQYRQRRRGVARVDSILLQPSPIDPAPSPAPVSVPYTSAPAIKTVHRASATSTSVSAPPCKKLDISPTSTSSSSTSLKTRVVDMKGETEMLAGARASPQSPTRPSLSHLRLRSSRLQSQTLKLSYRTSTL